MRSSPNDNIPEAKLSKTVDIQSGTPRGSCQLSSKFDNFCIVAFIMLVSCGGFVMLYSMFRRAFYCSFGKHARSRGKAYGSDSGFQSECRYCGIAMHKTANGSWVADH